MNLSPLWVPFLKGRGFETKHWATIGSVSAKDSQIVDYAAANGFAIITQDLDFGALLATRKTKSPSVIQLRSQDVLPAAMGETVIRALIAARAHLEMGALLTVDPGRHRIRVLPL